MWKWRTKTNPLIQKKKEFTEKILHYQLLIELNKKVDSDKIAFGIIDSDKIFQSCMLDFDQILIDKCCVIPLLVIAHSGL